MFNKPVVVLIAASFASLAALITAILGLFGLFATTTLFLIFGAGAGAGPRAESSLLLSAVVTLAAVAEVWSIVRFLRAVRQTQIEFFVWTAFSAAGAFLSPTPAAWILPAIWALASTAALNTRVGDWMD